MPRHPVDAPFTRGNDTAEHAKYRPPVGPASDYGVRIGTPVYPIFPVVRLERHGSSTADGGYELRGFAANGDWWSVQHLSAYVRRDAAGEDDQVAWSGNTGRLTIGPHVHAYVVVRGVRMSVWEYLTILAGIDAEPFNPTESEWDEMASQEQIEQAFEKASAKMLDQVVLRITAALSALRDGILIIHGTGRAADSDDPRNGRWSIKNGNLEYLGDPSVGFVNTWGTTENTALIAQYVVFPTTGNKGAFNEICRLNVSDWPVFEPEDVDAAGVLEYLRAKRWQAGA